MSLHVVYLVNQYPSISHTFIRREIQALERLGVVVNRIALRGWDSPLAEEADRRERLATRYVLRQSAMQMALSVARIAVAAPRHLVAAIRLAIHMSRGSDRRLAIHLAYLVEACVIRGWIGDGTVKHLHAHFATNPAEIAMLVHALGGPAYSFTAHGSDIMDRPAQMGLDQTVGRAAFVVAVCHFGKSQLMKWIPHGLWRKIAVVRCGLEPDYGTEVEQRASSSKRIVCIGRLSREKGQLLLVEAVSRLRQRADTDFEVVMIGDGPMRTEIEGLIARLGLEQTFRMTGSLDAAGVAAELREARGLVVPSLSEGLPVVIMEAMAHGVPVVAPYLAGIPELVADGLNGWLFPAGDVDSLAGALESCLRAEPVELEAMGMHAMRCVGKAHDVDVEAAKLEALFSESVQAGNRSGVARTAATHRDC